MQLLIFYKRLIDKNKKSSKIFLSQKYVLFIKLIKIIVSQFEYILTNRG